MNSDVLILYLNGIFQARIPKYTVNNRLYGNGKMKFTI